MPQFFKASQVFFLAMIKYFYAPIYGIAIGTAFWPMYFSLISGGVLAFLIYYNISKIWMFYLSHFGPLVARLLPASWQQNLKRRKVRRLIKKRNRRKFTRRNKILIKFRKNYGMWGIILFTPVLLSLPVGAFLLRKYYRDNPLAIPLAITSIVVEGLILCVIYWNLAKI
jgi:polyferredoxin